MTARMTGAELRAIREKLSLTQGQLAALLGYSAQARISEMEGRNTVPGPVAVAVRAMQAFGTPDAWPD